MTEIERRIGCARQEAGKVGVAVSWGSAWFGGRGALGGGMVVVVKQIHSGKVNHTWLTGGGEKSQAL